MKLATDVLRWEANAMKVWKKRRSNVKHYLALNVKEIENSREMEYLALSMLSFNCYCYEITIGNI
jgi:hypothetical protein